MNIHTILNMFSEPNRLRIISILYETELSVSDIAEVLDLKQANTSRHLSKLYEEGIVRNEKDKKQIFYFLNPAYKNNCKILRPVLEAYRTYDAGKKDMERLNELLSKK